MQFIEPQDILNATNNGLDIILYLYPQAADSVERPTRKFKKRDNEKTASASLKQAPDGNWLVTDFGGDQTPRNGIGCYAEENNLSWADALQELGERFKVSGENKKSDVFRADYTERAADNESEPEGKWSYDLRDSMSDFEIQTLFSKNTLSFIGWNKPDKKKEAYSKIKTICNRFCFHPVSSYTIIKNRKAMTFSSTDQYPIFMIAEDKFQKIYQPRHADKGMRFMYIPGGEKPKDFMHGLIQAKADLAKKAEKIDDDPEYDLLSDDEKAKKREADRGNTKHDEIILVSGGSDALNVALLGYWPVWLNSETASLEQWQWADLSKIAKKVYQLQDIDDTGKGAAHKNALQYLDLYTIELPEALKLKRDARLHPCKDLRDYLNHYSYWDFKELVAIALPYRFWEKYPEYTGRGENKVFVGYKYDFDNVQAYNFLAKNGFYRMPFEGKKTEYIYIQVEGNIVKETKANKVKNFMHNFLIDRKVEKDLRNTLYRSPQLGEASLSNLPETLIDFIDNDENRQFLFFNNCTWEVKANEIIHNKAGQIHRYIWEKDVVEHNAKLDEPPFTITKDPDDGSYNIVVNTDQCPFLNYLIQTSRIHWRLELEDKLNNLPLPDQEAYRKKHLYDIAGPNLTPGEQEEQKLHLINKIFAIGYLLHRHKDDSQSWAVIAMDNKINEDGGSHGGSGKSILMQKAIPKILKRTFIIPGTNPKKTEDPHVYDGLTEHHRYVYIDDMDKYMKFRFFYDLITSDLTVNPKNNQPYTIPYPSVPKLGITTNFTLLSQDPSTERRVLYTVFSDYYHNKGENTDYLEDRSPKTETGKNLFTEFDSNEWNSFYNTMARCLQFYLGTKNKIGPPMDNVTKRNLQTVMGLNFENWASVYFSDESGNTDRLIVREVAFKDFEYRHRSLGWSPQKFNEAIKAFCRYNKYILNPVELRTADHNKRIIKRVKVRNQKNDGTWVETGEMSAREMLYIQTDFDKPLNGVIEGAVAGDGATDDLPF